MSNDTFCKLIALSWKHTHTLQHQLSKSVFSWYHCTLEGHRSTMRWNEPLSRKVRNAFFSPQTAPRDSSASSSLQKMARGCQQHHHTNPWYETKRSHLLTVKFSPPVTLCWSCGRGWSIIIATHSSKTKAMPLCAKYSQSNVKQTAKQSHLPFYFCTQWRTPRDSTTLNTSCSTCFELQCNTLNTIAHYTAHYTEHCTLHTAHYTEHCTL